MITEDSSETLDQQIQASVAMASPAHLKQWLRETGRTFLVLKTDDLVDALPWPEGVRSLIQLVECYRQHRQGIPVEYKPCPRCKGAGRSPCTLCSNSGNVVSRTKSDLLESEEARTAIEFLQTLIP